MATRRKKTPGLGAVVQATQVAFPDLMICMTPAQVQKVIKSYGCVCVVLYSALVNDTVGCRTRLLARVDKYEKPVKMDEAGNQELIPDLRKFLCLLK